MLPSTPQATTATALISPFATQYPAGGMTSSLGNGRTEDSTAMSATIPRYPRSSRPRSSQSMNCSTIEAVLPNQGHEPGVAQGGLPDLEIGRASCRERGCIRVVAGACTSKHQK